jgi:neutral ceramidase
LRISTNNTSETGTTDGPGAFDFTQGESGAPKDPLWDIVGDAIAVPTPEQVACQQPKPILLDVGNAKTPYAWSPNIVDVQSLRVGQFIMVISPSEATTMSGRRWRDAVAKEAAATFQSGSVPPKVLLGGPANTYAHYLATPEEYDVQRYEGASTLYGRHELDAYINLTLSNLHYLAPTATTTPPPGPSPPDNRNNSLDLISPVVLDSSGSDSFGDCTTQPSASYTRGSVVNATFVGANPRNNLRLEGTFAAIEQQQSDGTWKQLRSDNDWALVYTWTRTSTILGTSSVVITWETSASTDAPGTYRTRYYGDSKNILGQISAFSGTSNSYTLS